uniref:AB hydrolase-1 domain-containing protein n=1 Tax=Aplanochytrium stocchinoi TaxID=215587 RepID=A0A7S3PQL4_9STRA|mmetsp:Transcript_6313/g.7953  ORF Transcript_6313/g.7953 Transcript_6313/m.7953 type:complete len:311 (-) Transcript_6313:1170-2102(-)|eukprot:CAMPEP_0204843580 /NCGR_PEP_ID=MMETSP1346-20131115/48061_1 /ASSEMBLY_ACC=CAM_ASM_000771 /TAXON_ID=215587 /ORGANISM="Aplanochytrium stocchinoi, Strain GSBS06" /LENGTH=310 /DNA_ID=CAMNT_0051982743 /DNA_START=295 /DNA_END=1227 /DNA_ORIENTATION=-
MSMFSAQILRRNRVFLGLKSRALSQVYSKRRFLSQNASHGALTKYASSGDVESAYSLLFLHGAWENAQSWADSAKYFAKLGHNSATLEFSGFSNSSTSAQTESEGGTKVKNLVDQVHSAVTELGPLTLLVAPCLGGFIAQKYLESWGVPGLVLVNSFPPNASNVLRRIADLKPEEPFDSNALAQFGYTGIFSSLLGKPRFTVAPEKLFGTAADDANISKLKENLQAPTTELILDVFQNPVKLEPGSVPILVVQSTEDKIISDDDIQSIMTFHNAEQLVKIDRASHLFVLNDSQARDQLHEAIHKWFDETF